MNDEWLIDWRLTSCLSYFVAWLGPLNDHKSLPQIFTVMIRRICHKQAFEGMTHKYECTYAWILSLLLFYTVIKCSKFIWKILIMRQSTSQSLFTFPPKIQRIATAKLFQNPPGNECTRIFVLDVWMWMSHLIFRARAAIRLMRVTMPLSHIAHKVGIDESNNNKTRRKNRMQFRAFGVYRAQKVDCNLAASSAVSKFPLCGCAGTCVSFVCAMHTCALCQSTHMNDINAERQASRHRVVFFEKPKMCSMFTSENYGSETFFMRSLRKHSPLSIRGIQKWNVNESLIWKMDARRQPVYALNRFTQYPIRKCLTLKYLAWIIRIFRCW